MFYFDLIKAWLIAGIFWCIVILLVGLLLGYPLWFIVYDMTLSLLVALSGGFAGSIFAVFLFGVERGATEVIVRKGSQDRHALINIGYSPIVLPRIKKNKSPYEQLKQDLRSLIPKGFPPTVYPRGHAGTDLLTHCESVSANLVRLWKKACADGLINIKPPRYFKGWPEGADISVYTEDFVALVGFAHDIGKLISYVNENGRWRDRDRQHALHSARLLKNSPYAKTIPYSLLNEAAFIVEYYHSGYSLPNASWIRPSAIALMGLLIIADQETSRGEGIDPATEYDATDANDLSFPMMKEIDETDIVGDDPNALEALNIEKANTLITDLIADIVTGKIKSNGSVYFKEAHISMIHFESFISELKSRLKAINLNDQGAIPNVLISYIREKGFRTVRVAKDDLILCRYHWEDQPIPSIGIPFSDDDLSMIGIFHDDNALPVTVAGRYWRWSANETHPMDARHIPGDDDDDHTPVRRPLSYPPRPQPQPGGPRTPPSPPSARVSSESDDLPFEWPEKRPNPGFRPIRTPPSSPDSPIDDDTPSDLPPPFGHDRVSIDDDHDDDNEDSDDDDFNPKAGLGDHPFEVPADIKNDLDHPPSDEQKISTQMIAEMMMPTWKQMVEILKKDPSITRRLDERHRPIAIIPADHPLFKSVILAIDANAVPPRAVMKRTDREVILLLF